MPTRTTNKKGRGVRAPQAHRPTTLPGKRVIGIDLATTRCCIAYSSALWDELERLNDQKTRPPNVEIFSGWMAADGGSRTNPITALYYEALDRLPVTGNELDPILKAKSRVGTTSFNTEKFFRLWKLMFHNDQGDPVTKALQADIQRKLDLWGMTMAQLLRGWVAVTYASLFEEDANGQVRLRIHDERIMELEVVVAVPPGRSVIAHEEVRQAFIQGPIRAHQVNLVSEPEAMFRSWIADGIDARYWKVGQTYLVCDGGGGTCCFVRFRLSRLDPLGFSQEYESESIICGAETISNAFEDLAATKVPIHIPHRAWVLDNLRRQFDNIYKHTFGGAGYDEREYCFEKPWDRNDDIVFACEQIAACFEDCIKKLFGGIRHQLQRGHLGHRALPAHTSVDYLVLGGGLFENPYVLKRIRDDFPSLKVCELSTQTSDSKKHVARGAVLTRLCDKDDFITSRPILRSKAVLTMMSVTDIIRRSPIYPLLELKVDKQNGKRYFWAAQWLVKQGDEAMLKHADDFFEIASESSAEKARTRAFNLAKQDLEFTETILTVNYHPGNAGWAALRKDDNRLIDPNGNLLPDYMSEEITWDPQEFGIPIGSLEVVHPSASKPAYRVLRYSIQMQLREVGTIYWIKAYFWSTEEKTFKALLSEQTERRQALFQSHQISQILSQSRELGSGTRFEDGPASDSESPEDLHPRNQSTVLPISSHKPDRVSTHGAPYGAPEIVPASNLGPMVEASNMVSLPSKVNSRDPAPGTSAPAISGLRFPVIPKKRPASTENTDQPLLKVSRGSLNIRPTQRQSTESSGEYSLGARRNNGGCWTCAFRNLKCQQGSPICPQCSKVGVVCEYGRPVWWYKEELKEAQREINKTLIKEKARMSSKTSCSAKVSAPRGHAASPSRTDAEQAPGPAMTYSGSQTSPQQFRTYQPPMAIEHGAPRPATMDADKLRDDTAASSQKLAESFDLYGTSPPPRGNTRQQEDDSLGSHVRRSTRPRARPTPVDKEYWDAVDEVLGLLSKSDSEAEDFDAEFTAHERSEKSV